MFLKTRAHIPPGGLALPEGLAGAAALWGLAQKTAMAYPDAVESGAERIALVGMSCQSSVPPVMWQRKVGKAASKPALAK